MQQTTRYCSFKELHKDVHVKYAKKFHSQKKGSPSIEILEDYKPKNGISHKEYKSKLQEQERRVKEHANRRRMYPDYERQHHGGYECVIHNLELFMTNIRRAIDKYNYEKSTIKNYQTI